MASIDIVDSISIEKNETMYGYFYSWAGDLISSQLEQYSAHTRNELAMLRSFIRKGDNIIDIGAHIGTFSIPFARFNGGQGKIFSFEADPTNYQLLQKNIVANTLEDVVLPMCAVISEKKHNFKKILPENGNTGMYYFMPTHELGDEGLESINIDQWYDQSDIDGPIHFIKIDTEGSEFSVLLACKNLIERYKPIIYLEINTEALLRFGSSAQDIENMLTTHGYHFFKNIGVRNSNNDEFTIARLRRLTGEGNFFDVLAVPSSSKRYPKKFKNNFISIKLWRLKRLVISHIEK